MIGIPQPVATDAEDVAWALQTAEALWKRHERVDAIVWLRRAAQAAGEAEDDDRALSLARCAAELSEWFAANPSASLPPNQPSSMPPASGGVDELLSAQIASVPPPAPFPPAPSAIALERPSTATHVDFPISENDLPDARTGAEVHAGLLDPWAGEGPESETATRQHLADVEPTYNTIEEEDTRTQKHDAAAQLAAMAAALPPMRPPFDSEEVITSAREVPRILLDPVERAAYAAEAAQAAERAAPPAPPPPAPPPAPPPVRAAPPLPPPPRAPPPPPPRRPAPPAAAAPLPAPVPPPAPPPHGAVEVATASSARPSAGFRIPGPLPGSPSRDVPREVPRPVSVRPGSVRPASMRPASARPPNTPSSPPEESTKVSEGIVARALSTPVAPPPAEVPVAPVAPPAPAAARASLDLSDVVGLGDLPDDARDEFARVAKIYDLAPGDEASGFALALVLQGTVDVAATIVDAPADRAEAGAVLRSRGTVGEGLPLRLIAANDRPALVATWAIDAVEAAFASCPWVEDDLRAAADRTQALVGVTMGSLADRLDASIRYEVTSRLEARPLAPGEVLVAQGEPVPGLTLVGVGELEVLDGETVRGTVGLGEFLFASSVLGAEPAPGTARAGAEGAVILFADRSVAQELLVTCPPLLELFAGM